MIITGGVFAECLKYSSEFNSSVQKFESSNQRSVEGQVPSYQQHSHEIYRSSSLKHVPCIQQRVVTIYRYSSTV